VVPARDLDRARTALKAIKGVQIEPMDLMEPISVAVFCRKMLEEGQPVSILINSAGVMAPPLLRNAEGHESQFAINHLGHYRLVCGLWPLLTASGAARIVSVSSRGHMIADIDFEDINFIKRPYEKWIAYGQSKTANALFAIALDKKGRDRGVRAFSVHPGQIMTDLARHLTSEEIAAFGVYDRDGNVTIDPFNDKKTPEQGAATSLWCVTSADLEEHGGVYCEDCNIAERANASKGRRGVAAWAACPDRADQLWQITERLTHLSVN
jgi:NAD(P)-dependent dehydrogenase (short-subunit alcohol dehydrogenase family)